ncbi:uncharacterized protein LOC135814433 [Sycon ciliatum]|uniref:uncharacterized protein LOC135814433 n=1 Tax=Sycon ciliatum TaxID=27933 RepID=UPI0031F664D9
MMATNGGPQLLMATKRRNPFGERSLAVLPSAEAQSATETTQARLMSAQQNLMPLPQPACPLDRGECFVCRVNDVIVQCEFCERKACQGHTKLCHLCTGVFCSLCSTIDYEVRYGDSAICLTCEDERRRGNPGHSRKTPQHNVTWSESLHPVQVNGGGSGGDGQPSAGRFFQSAPFGSKRA